MADIFISYAREERGKVEKLAGALEAEGYSVWWDRRIQSGAEFTADIERELDAAKAVIVCWSREGSKSRWVKDEANVAAEAGKLLAVSMDGVMPPLGFRQYHFTDFAKWNGTTSSDEFTALDAAIRARISGEATPAPAAKAAPAYAAVLSYLRKPVALGIFGAVAIVVAASLFWMSVRAPGIAVASASVSAPPSIAVAPIGATGDDPALSQMAQVLTEDIASGLSKFSYFQVASGDEASARYRLQATVRKVGGTLRLTARLTDIDKGEQIWGETFDRAYSEDTLLEIEDDLTDHVVASVADPYGALMRDLAAPVAAKPPETLTPFEAILRHTIYRQRLTAADQLVTREALERASEMAPSNADVWATLAAVTIEEIKHDYNRRPDAGDRALKAAQRAIAIDRNNAYANFELAEVQYFRGDLDAFRAAAERAIELNPRDTEQMAMLGILMGYAGDWDRSDELTSRAMALNPNHPGWYWFSQAINEYRKGNYDRALVLAQRVNTPGYFADPYVRAMIYGQLGRRKEAKAALDEFIALWPGDVSTFREKNLDVWFYAQPRLIEQILDGLQKAGLDPGESVSAPAPAAVEKSVAVLPFIALSSGEDDGYFADGLTEEILNSLAAAPDLLVTARTSSFYFKDKNLPIDEIAERLGVDHVVEGSVRRAGDTVRITAQLIRASDGFHLWSETYDRSMSDVLAVQTEIAEKVATALGVLLDRKSRKAMADAGIGDVEAFIHFQRGMALMYEAHAKGRFDVPMLTAANKELDKALAIKPDFSLAYLIRTDRNAHILMDVLSTRGKGAATDGGVTADEASRELFADLEKAARYAQSAEERTIVELNRIFLSADWSGLKEMNERVLNSDAACQSDLWLSTTAILTGLADAFIPYRKAKTETCDPYDLISRYELVLGLLAEGRTGEAEVELGEFKRRFERSPMQDQAEITVMLAKGETVDPKRYATSTDFIHALSFAAAGNADEARSLIDKLEANDEAPYLLLWIYAATGDKASAERLAAIIDASTLGAAQLTSAIEICSCGELFDLAATPNFARQLAEAGAPWPPASPARYPLKDW